jgi:hypothetical protein
MARFKLERIPVTTTSSITASSATVSCAVTEVESATPTAKETA